jgi:predicted P-loop ATPase
MMEEPYDIRKHLSVLTRSKGSKTKFHCPACDKNDLDIHPLTGAYRCFSGGCEPEDIRQAIDKLEGKPEWKPEKDVWVKPVRPKSEKEYFYPERASAPQGGRDGNNLVKVTRKDDGNGNKKFSQFHWAGGKWVSGNPSEKKKLVPIYRYAEVQQAIEHNELIFVVEGEATADLLWKLGIAATTTIGGSGGYSTYGDYRQDLIGARLVLAPDRDSNGLKYIGNVATDFSGQIEGYYLAGTQGLWKKPEWGMDIGDDIHDNQLTKEQILAKVISPGEYQEAIEPKAKTEKKAATTSTVKDKDYQAIGRKSGINLSDAGVDKHGTPLSKYLKLELDLIDLFGSRLELNEMTREIELDRKPIDLNLAKSFVSKSLEYDTSAENCILALNAIATTNKYHPVREYLESLRGRTLVDFDVFNNIATLFLGNSDPLANKMMAKTLVGAVTRVNRPGTKVDTLTVLQGGQGFLKSTFLKVLAGEFWFCDDIRDLENKDELAKLARYWMIELAEVDYLMGRKEVESFKRFLSTTADTYRPPYGRANIRHERTCTLFATTNKIEFLKDPTGSRRYWVIKVGGKIDCELVAKFRDIIWATALAAYERGDTWWLDDNEELAREERSEEFREPDAWEEIIFSKWDSLPIAEYKGSDRVDINRIFDLLDLDNDKRNKPNRNRIASILKLWGFENKTINTEAGKVKAWLRPKNRVDFTPVELTQDDDFKNKVLGKYLFLGSNSSITSSVKSFEMELNLEPNPLDNEKKDYHQNGSQHGENLELNLEPKNCNLELNYKKELSVVGSELSSTAKELSSKSSLIPELFPPPMEVNPTILEPELSSTSNAGAEDVLPMLEPKNLRKEHFHIGQKNNSKEITRFKVGVRVQYVGKNPNLVRQYAGILEIHEILSETYTCKKPDGSLTSWIEIEDLQLVEVAI